MSTTQTVGGSPIPTRHVFITLNPGPVTSGRSIVRTAHSVELCKTNEADEWCTLRRDVLNLPTAMQCMDIWDVPAEYGRMVHGIITLMHRGQWVDFLVDYMAANKRINEAHAVDGRWTDISDKTEYMALLDRLREPDMPPDWHDQIPDE